MAEQFAGETEGAGFAAGRTQVHPDDHRLSHFFALTNYPENLLSTRSYPPVLPGRQGCRIKNSFTNSDHRDPRRDIGGDLVGIQAAGEHKNGIIIAKRL